MKKITLYLTLLFTLISFSLSAQMIQSFPHNEDFEANNTCTGSCNSPCALMGGWANEQGGADNAEWTVDVGGTSSFNTGPSVDLNPGTNSGKYLYLESSSPCYPNATALLYSPSIDLSTVSSMKMIFGNHMFGATQGTMYVDVSNDNGVTFVQGLWSRSGDNGDVWNVDTVDFTAYAGDTIIVRFRGVTTTSFSSDMAIDNVTLYEPLPLDAGISAIPQPGLPSCNLTNSNVEVSVFNFGFNQLDSVDIAWSVNGIAETTYRAFDTIAPSTSKNYILGVKTFVDGDVLRVWTTNPNGGTEMGSGAGNDTLELIIKEGLSGTYTIGTGGDYTTINDAVNDLNAYGICSAVTFNIAFGLYNEQVVLNKVDGSSLVNTITFQSASLDPLTVEITYMGTNNIDNFVFMLDGAENFILNKLTITNPGTSYGRNLHVLGGSHNNTFSGNRFIGDSTNSTTSTFKANIYGEPNSIDTNNVFINNIIKYGSYGMYWFGGNTASLEYGTVIENNIVEDCYYRSIMIYYQEDAKITNNILKLSGNYTGAGTVVYAYYLNGASQITGNKIVNPYRGYGFFLNSCTSNAFNNSIVLNNFISVGDTTINSTDYGIFSNNCSNFKLNNNSIYLNSIGTNARALYVSNGSKNIIYNNNIFNYGPGYGLYYNNGVDESNNNNVYAPNGSYGYYGGRQLTLADFQSASGFDLNSVSGDPGFISFEDLHTCSDVLLDGKGKVDSSLTMDIDGQLRDLNGFDIGADEFLGINSFSFPMDSVYKCSTDAVTLGGFNPASDGSFLWSTNDTTSAITTTASGTFNVAVTTSCGSNNADVYVENIPDAVAGFTSQRSFLTGAFTNTSSNENTYLWDFGDGSTSTDENPIHIYANDGTYTVTLTVTGVCGTDVFTEQFTTTLVGLDENNLSELLALYPNPNKGIFTIQIANINANVNVEIFNTQGKRVWNNAFTANNNINETINLSNLAKGVYTLRLTSNNKTAVKRLIIE